MNDSDTFFISILKHQTVSAIHFRISTAIDIVLYLIKDGRNMACNVWRISTEKENESKVDRMRRAADFRITHE